ncbi:CsbD family protein [Humidisolicoccus flavus]|uniref:CsbD family protein n=1 Tax=Humidisolicoccus flavus TaxID=3111414 RepID=UPI00324465AD
MSASDKIQNAANDIVGKAKEAFGSATDNEEVRREGQQDQAKANLGKAAENVKDVFK